MSTVYAYFCVKSGLPESDRVREAVTEKAKALAKDLGFDVHVAEEAPAMARVEAQKRPRFVQLHGRIRAGDHLVILDMWHISRSLIVIIDSIEHFLRIGITIHVLQWEKQLLKLEGEDGLAIMRVMRFVAQAAKRDQVRPIQPRRRRTSKRNLEREYVPRRHPGYGKSHIRRCGAWAIVWDPYQCDLIRELKGLVDDGVSWVEIGRRFNKAELADGIGRLWCPKYRGGGKQRSILTNRIKKLYAWYVNLLREGGELGA